MDSVASEKHPIGVGVVICDPLAYCIDSEPVAVVIFDGVRMEDLLGCLESLAGGLQARNLFGVVLLLCTRQSNIQSHQIVLAWDQQDGAMSGHDGANFANVREVSHGNDVDLEQSVSNDSGQLKAADLPLLCNLLTTPKTEFLVTPSMKK